MNEIPQEIIVVQKSQPKSALGIVIAAAILLFLGMAMQTVSMFLLPLWGLCYLAAFILSFIVMARGMVLFGLILLIMSIGAPWAFVIAKARDFVESQTRAARIHEVR